MIPRQLASQGTARLPRHTATLPTVPEYTPPQLDAGPPINYYTDRGGLGAKVGTYPHLGALVKFFRLPRLCWYVEETVESNLRGAGGDGTSRKFSCACLLRPSAAARRHCVYRFVGISWTFYCWRRRRGVCVLAENGWRGTRKTPKGVTGAALPFDGNDPQ